VNYLTFKNAFLSFSLFLTMNSNILMPMMKPNKQESVADIHWPTFFSLFLHHAIPPLDTKDVSTLSCVKKVVDESETAKQRQLAQMQGRQSFFKPYISPPHHRNSIVVWGPDNNTCALTTINGNDFRIEGENVSLHRLQRSKKDQDMRLFRVSPGKHIPCFPSYIRDPSKVVPTPFFNAQGDACVYYFSDITKLDVAELSIDANGERKRRSCFVEVHGKLYPLAALQHSPIFFVAFVQSRDLTRSSGYSIFSYKGVQINGKPLNEIQCQRIASHIAASKSKPVYFESQGTHGGAHGHRNEDL
jgi:hypothetical protein